VIARAWSRGRIPIAAGLLAAGCAAPEPAPDAGPLRVHAEAWPEADRLFHQDPRWLGADAAFSIPLDEERVLWLFGDTFVATSPALRRAEAGFARNTVGLQTGRDPRTATMRFSWREVDGEPRSFFPDEGERWFWPQHGIRLGRGLLVFLTRVRDTPGEGLGFKADGWRVAVIADASGAPETWEPVLLAPEAPAGWVVGAALCTLGPHVVALAFREPGDHSGALVRWPRAALCDAAGRPRASAAAFAGAEWWMGDGWRTLAPGAEPAIVLADAGPESSLHHDAASGRWLHVRSVGFGATTIGVSWAPRIEGPWSGPLEVFRPPESDRPDAFVYAAKAHPELRCDGLAVTYAANTLADFTVLLGDERLYWPRFVRLRLAEPGDGPAWRDPRPGG